ncbi:hypothetical protein TWF281_007209 [Arthrobotrys megalospora]
MQNSHNQENELRGSSSSLLLSLPEELIEHVCQQFSSCRDRRSLAFLCRTSKTLNRIGTRFLYSKFSSGGYMSRLAFFLRTLCERPDLGTYVHSLSLGSDIWFRLPQEHIDFISKAAERFGLDVAVPLMPSGYPSGGSDDEESEDGEGDEDQLGSNDSSEGEVEHNGHISGREEDKEEAYERSQLGQYPFETMAQLTIALTPNLRELQVTARQIMCDDGEGAFTLLEELAKRSPPPVSLPHLRHFSFGHEDCREVSFKYFEGVIVLAPNIRTIHGHPCFDQPRYAPEAPINISNVTELRFKSGHLSATGLRAILSSCERLEIFQYHYDTIYAGLDPGCATPREIVDILSKHKDSLRYIYIDLGSREEHQGGLFFGFCIEGQEILSLREFSCLETFNIDGSSILFPEAGSKKYHTNILVDMLPRSIRNLRLKDMQKEAATNLVTLTDSIDSFPQLSEVFLNGNGIGGPLGKFEVIFEESEIDLLRERLTSRGIRFLKQSPSRWEYISDDEETTEDW